MKEFCCATSPKRQQVSYHSWKSMEKSAQSESIVESRTHKKLEEMIFFDDLDFEKWDGDSDTNGREPC